MRMAMLTTFDNPYNPFDDFENWKQFDEDSGYYSCEYLARIAKLSVELSEKDEQIEIENAIDEIVDLNILGIYRKIVRDG